MMAEEDDEEDCGVVDDQGTKKKNGLSCSNDDDKAEATRSGRRGDIIEDLEAVEQWRRGSDGDDELACNR